MIGVFCALDASVLRVLRGVLIPMFLIIGVWGGPRRVYAAFKFFLYTLLGSVLMLVALLLSIPGRHHRHRRAAEDAAAAWHADLALPRVLRLVRGQGADVAGAHLAAGRARRGADRRLGGPGGVMLKMGGYGFLRFSLPMLPRRLAPTSRR